MIHVSVCVCVCVGWFGVQCTHKYTCVYSIHTASQTHTSRIMQQFPTAASPVLSLLSFSQEQQHLGQMLRLVHNGTKLVHSLLINLSQARVLCVGQTKVLAFTLPLPPPIFSLILPPFCTFYDPEKCSHGLLLCQFFTVSPTNFWRARSCLLDAAPFFSTFLKTRTTPTNLTSKVFTGVLFTPKNFSKGWRKILPAEREWPVTSASFRLLLKGERDV